MFLRNSSYFQLFHFLWFTVVNSVSLFFFFVEEFNPATVLFRQEIIVTDLGLYVLVRIQTGLLAHTLNPSGYSKDIPLLHNFNQSDRNTGMLLVHTFNFQTILPNFVAGDSKS